MRPADVASKALKAVGVALFVVVYLALLLLLTGLGFFMEDPSPVLLVAYVVVSLCLLIGVAWPRAFGRLLKGEATRRRVVRVFGIPAGALLALLYLLTTFHVGDLDGILVGLLAVASSCLIVGLARPSAFARHGRTPTRAALAKVFGGAAVAFLALLLVTLPMLETYRLARLDRAADERRQVVSLTSRTQGSSGDGQVEVHPLHIGDTKVTYGQFYGGLSGWEGLTGYVRTLIDGDVITVPVYSYLIDHPDHGLMLVDTGVSWAQAHDHDGYYAGIVERLLTERDEYVLPVAQELEVQVERLGYELGDIENVFMTHVHEDHAGGLHSLPNARVVLAKRDWKQGVLYGPSWATVEDDLDLISYTSGPFRGFDASLDYFGDGSVRLLATPGHSPGHTSVLLDMGGHDALFVGDNVYTLRHLAVDEVRQMTIGGTATERQVDAIRSTQALLEASPGTVTLYAHDHTDYQFELVEPFLADGTLSAGERRAIDAYEAGVFTDGWHLRPGITPHFVPPDGDERTGRVRFR